MTYSAPLSDMLFNIEHIAKIQSLSSVLNCDEADLDTARAVLEECARFNEEIIAPLNFSGDQDPFYLTEGNVITSPGFKAAYKQFAHGG